MVLVGYDDNRHALRLINSWGSQWGDHGYGWIDYDFLRQVANEGYVAKDAINAPIGPEPTPPTPTPTQDPVVVEPAPTPVAKQISFETTKVETAARLPDRPDLVFLRFNGSLRIPPGIGHVEQVVIHFFYDRGDGKPGQPVGSRIAQFADVRWCAATGTPPYVIPPDGADATWRSIMPYRALAFPTGRALPGVTYTPRTSRLVAQPVLFIDNFGVSAGQPVPFEVAW